MFGKTVLGIEGHAFEAELDAVKAAKGVAADLDLDAATGLLASRCRTSPL